MALIKCERCGKMFSDRANQCPVCGCTKDESKQIALVKKQQAEREAEEARLKAEEEVRIRAEKRAEWWRKNKKKVMIVVSIVITLIIAGLVMKNIMKNIAFQKSIVLANQYIASGDSCVAIFRFEEAGCFYQKAKQSTEDDETRRLADRKRYDYLPVERRKADAEYDNALKRLKIILEADDYVFNEYSNQSLDKMIEIYPNRRESIYYKKMRDGISDIDATISTTQVLHTTQYLRLDMKGSIGTSQGVLEYDEQEDKGYNSYYFSDATVKRTVSLASHEGDRLKLNSYDLSGKYVGQFDGTLVAEGEQISYKGTFTNYKGVSVNFKLYQD